MSIMIMFILSYLPFIFLISLIETRLSTTTVLNEPEEYEYIYGDEVDDKGEAVPDYEEESLKQQRSIPFESHYVGTNLLDARSLQRKCFSPEDERLLAARMDFEYLLPQLNSSFVLETDQSVDSMLQYFYGINEIIGKFSGADAKLLSRLAMSDMIGGYLNYFYVPLVKLSFYAGTLEYSNAIEILKLRTKCKRLLNTNGNGWRPPRIEWFKTNRFQIIPLDLMPSKTFDADHPPCVNLILAEDDPDTNSPLLVSMPKLEVAEANSLGNIWLPFKRKHNFNLAAKNSAFILLRYYVAVQKCYAFKSVSPKKFHRRLADWLSDRILPYLDDGEFYPGLGAVLRIVETIQSPGKRMIIASDRYQSEAASEPPKSKEFIQIEKQVSQIIEERKKPGFLENLSETLQRKEHKNRNMVIIITSGICLMSVFIVITSCCWMRKRGHPDSTPKLPRKKDTIKPNWISRICCPCPRKSNAKEDEVELVPDSPSVMSRGKEEELFVRNLNETRGTRLSNTSIKKGEHDKSQKTKRTSSIKVMKSCCFSPRHKRRVNSSQSSLFRPIGNDRKDGSKTSIASLGDYYKEDDGQMRPLLRDTISTKPKPDVQVTSARSGKNTRIPILQRTSVQNRDDVLAEHKTHEGAPTIEEPRNTLKPKNARNRIERKPCVPLRCCSKRVSNPSHSSWETLPSEKR